VTPPPRPVAGQRRRTLAPPAGIAPLAGYTVAVATDRRRHPLAALLEAAGARTAGVQAVRAFSAVEDPSIRELTQAVLADPIDELLVTSDFGFRSWLRAAKRWGLAEPLVAGFAVARLLASNPRAADALRDVGLHEIWSTAASSTEELVRYLLAQPLHGRRVVVQSDGVSVAELCHALRSAGAEVFDIATYQYQPPPHADLLRRLGDLILNRQVDAVAFTGAPAVEHLIAQATVDRRRDQVLNALADEVPALCLGSVTVAPLTAGGVPAAVAIHPYLEELVALACATVPQQAIRLRTAGYRMEIRGQAVVLNDELIPVQAGPIAVLRALARHPGRVLSCAEIRRATPNWAAVDDHAIEMAVSRLRRTLHDGELVQTVMRRGYRLAA
jgi:uroporphyrinogen-III synthase